jgi:photosystem II stability/assembly factor-like uncharacterized protein
MGGRFLVGTRKGLFTVERGRSGWSITRAHFLGDPVTMVLDAGPIGVFAALRHGHFGVKLHRSTDGGDVFAEVAAPAYPEGEAGAPSVDAIWALERGSGDRLWCGTIPGGLFESRDAGEHWALNRPLWDDERRKRWFGGGADQPALHSICVDPRDPRRLLVGVSCGGAWRSEDDGASWTVRSEGMFADFVPPDQAMDPVIQDPHRIVRAPSDPDVLWCQHHNGVFKSTDDGASWQELSAAAPSRFGFAVAVHPHDADTAWFVPAVKDEHRIPVDGRVVVSRTRDGGRSFEVLREGLPQVHAYDLVYRHALDVDATGEVLAFGSTTGALWLTEDGGDHWSLLTAHLPPIYCVRAV